MRERCVHRGLRDRYSPHMTNPQGLPNAPTRPVEVPRPESSAKLLGVGLFFLVVGGALMVFGWAPA